MTNKDVGSYLRDMRNCQYNGGKLIGGDGITLYTHAFRKRWLRSFGLSNTQVNNVLKTKKKNDRALCAKVYGVPKELAQVSDEIKLMVVQLLQGKSIFVEYEHSTHCILLFVENNIVQMRMTNQSDEVVHNGPPRDYNRFYPARRLVLDIERAYDLLFDLPIDVPDDILNLVWERTIVCTQYDEELKELGYVAYRSKDINIIAIAPIQ